MVQDQAADASIRLQIIQRLKKITADPVNVLWQVGGTLNQVQARYSGGGGEVG